MGTSPCVARSLSHSQVYPADYRRALAESQALAKAEASESELLSSYAVSGNGHKPKDAFEELKAMAAKASVNNPPKAIAIK